jgi:hypothetical protein
MALAARLLGAAGTPLLLVPLVLVLAVFEKPELPEALIARTR